MEFEFEWDEKKRKMNFEKHNFNFQDVEEIFRSFVIRRRDHRRDYGEIRYIAFGTLKGRVISIVYTERENRLRIISLRKAHEKEKKIYLSQKDLFGSEENRCHEGR